MRRRDLFALVGGAAAWPLAARAQPRSERIRRQTNGICERFHKTALNEFYRVAFRKKV